MPFVEMSDEEIAERHARDQGLALIDWTTLDFLICHAPKGVLIFNPEKRTYSLPKDHPMVVGRETSAA
jgi:hypothetical protein